MNSLQKIDQFLIHLNAKSLQHGNRSLYDHLFGTAILLQAQKQPTRVICAGGLHAIYGTQIYKKVLTADRKEVEAAFGINVERLVWGFYKLNRTNWLTKPDEQLVLTNGAPALHYLSRADLADLRLIELANLQEQGG